MQILIAEDEEKIADGYKRVLEGRGHKVVVTKDGKACVDHYLGRLSGTHKKEENPPFDLVILDYRMPVLDGMEAAKIILSSVPEQRIIFASAYLKETLLDSLRQLNRIIELLSKPFSLTELVEVVEDEHLYKQLQVLNVDIQTLKSWKPTHPQISGLLNGLMKLRNLNSDFFKKQINNEQKAQMRSG